jgi:protein O-GlcNAc transferase
VATLFAPVIERHDRSRFDIHCYYNYPSEDVVTQRIRRAADHWVDIHAWNDEMLAQRLRDDGIDVLVDLAGHTSYGRLRAYAGKPAPVQVSWLGYFATTGMTQMDAFITDPYSSPPGQEVWFSESLLRLPDTRFTFEAHDFYPEPGEPRRREPGAVTFGCLNNLAKINDGVLPAWAALLDQLPKSTLLIQALALEDAPNREAFLARCERSGIARARIELRPWTELKDSARTYHDIDIALDPFPFCGGMTSFDALWMGVPVVTLAGELIAGRQTAAMLSNLGLGEFIAKDVEAYVAIATRLANDPARLDHLRATLRTTFAASPLCDHDKFTRALEEAYLGLWRRWAAKAD